MTTHPIAGTRPRGATPDEDQLLAEELAARPQGARRARHARGPRPQRPRARRPARARSPSPKYMEVERYSHVLHLVSHVEARLAPGLDALDALRRVFPAGTLSGAPKVRAMQLIARARRASAAACTAARSATSATTATSTPRSRSGARSSRTASRTSTPAPASSRGASRSSEFEETEHKAAALRRAIELAAGDPAGGGPATRPRRAAGPPAPARRRARCGHDPRHRQLRLASRSTSSRRSRRRARRSSSSATTRSTARGSRRSPTIPAADLRGIVVSPGPGDPDDAGVSVDAIRRRRRPRHPAPRGLPRHAVDGGRVRGAIVRAPTLVHGESSEVTHDGAGLLAGLPPGSMAARYHSLVRRPGDAARRAVETTATAEDDAVVMGIRHAIAPDGGRPVPPRIRPHAAGPAPPRELPPAGGRGRGRPPRRGHRLVRDPRARRGRARRGGAVRGRARAVRVGAGSRERPGARIRRSGR